VKHDESPHLNIKRVQSTLQVVPLIKLRKWRCHGIAPSVWLLWQLLGNYRSDLGRYDAAHDAYARALECPGVEPSSVHLNRAAALAREDRAEEAFEALAQVTDPALELRRESLRVGFLVDADRYPEAVKAARKTLDRE
jgi:tetratricopeptide (TPR) repeat protein